MGGEITLSIATKITSQKMLVLRIRHQQFLKSCRWSHGEGNGTPLQYSCLENPMDGGAW